MTMLKNSLPFFFLFTITACTQAKNVGPQVYQCIANNPEYSERCKLQAVKEKKEAIEREVRHLEYERRRKIEEDFKLRKEQEIMKTKKLFSDAEKFDKATIYRNFIAATEQKAIQENNLNEELKEWIKWANEKADWFDPFTNKEDELLNDNDREEFHKPKQPNNYYRF